MGWGEGRECDDVGPSPRIATAAVHRLMVGGGADPVIVCLARGEARDQRLVEGVVERRAIPGGVHVQLVEFE